MLFLSYAFATEYEKNAQMSEAEVSIQFLKKLIDDVDKRILAEGEARVSFSEFELDHLSSIYRQLNNSTEKNLDEDKQTSKRLDSSKLPPGFFENPLALTSKDLIGLPKELMAELNDLDDTEVELLELFEMAKGTLVLDKIIAGLFHTTGKSYQRNTLTAKLYRMSKKGLVRSVPKKKGIYTTIKDDESI